jgi:hypothetical protein
LDAQYNDAVFKVIRGISPDRFCVYLHRQKEEGMMKGVQLWAKVKNIMKGIKYQILGQVHRRETPLSRTRRKIFMFMVSAK